MNFRRVIILASIGLVMVLITDLVAQETRRYINPGSAQDTTALSYSGAVMVGNTLYLSGTLGLDKNKEVPVKAVDEARNVLNNIRVTLESAGMSMDDLVFVQVFCSDVDYYDVFNKVYRAYFTEEFPARAFIGSRTLLFGARFEVQGIAVKQ